MTLGPLRRAVNVNRQHVYDMPYGDFKAFLNAWRAPESKGRDAKHVCEHELHTCLLPSLSPHVGRTAFVRLQLVHHDGQPGFLPLHRGAMRVVETELLVEASDGDPGCPFWNKALEIGALAPSAIWSQERRNVSRVD